MQMLQQDPPAPVQNLEFDRHTAVTKHRQPARQRCYLLYGLIVTTSLLAGCSISQRQAVDTNTNITVQADTTNRKNTITTACIGDIEPVPEGLVATEDPQLLKAALGEPMQGRLCKGQVFVANQPVLVYRGWNHANPNSLYGSWWAFTRPAGSRAQYRVDYAICPSWNPLTRVSVCQVKVGSKLVVGPGQSVACLSDQLQYAASPINQVFLPNSVLPRQPNPHTNSSLKPQANSQITSQITSQSNSQHLSQPQPQLLVENCRTEMIWQETD